ncbi:hypothetical protein R5M92_04340 [Halomonas sp. Bachu 37]|uniref:hypothetical protein n=1 Tax=Halomonas kashgarensis TaxID=3084920 RepID=UPI0032179FAF
MSDFIQEDAQENFTLALPLHSTQMRANELIINAREPSHDYAILQTLANKGRLKRSDTEDLMLVYSVIEDSNDFIREDMEGNITIVIGSLTVDDIVGFTEPTEQSQSGKTVATVSFKAEFAPWLDDADVQAIRGWSALMSEHIHDAGRNPASQPFSNTFMQSAFHTVAVAAGGGSLFDLDQASTFWINLALESYTSEVPFLRTDDGWTPAPNMAEWKLSEVNGIGNLTATDFEELGEASIARLNSKVQKPDPPSADELSVVLADANRLANMTFRTPLQDAGKRVCSAGYDTDLMGRETTLEYDCNNTIIEQLERMVDNGHVTRSVPRAGEVHYAIEEDLSSQLSGNGVLSIGTYAIDMDSLSQAVVELNPVGLPAYGTSVALLGQPYEWAKPYHDTSQHDRKEVHVMMLYTNGKWVNTW